MTSDVQQRIRRLFGLIILTFLVLIGWQSYWQVYKSDWLLNQPIPNRRFARAERNTPRGVIYDRRGERLAWSVEGERHYADPEATAAVLGYIDPRYGRTGVEAAWDQELTGLSKEFGPADLARILRNEKPHGKDLILTLDLGLQQAALKALAGRRGAIATIDPATGGILAIASSPTFNLETLAEDFTDLQARRDGILRNRALQDHYPPGSTMKLVTAAAALMHDVDPSTVYTCQGVTKLRGFDITDYHRTAHGTIAMENALVRSCNYYFASTALALGTEGFFETAGAFGFGTRWWDALPKRRMLPLPVADSSLAPHGRSGVYARDLANMGFGQATVVATPLQMAMVTAAIANDGTLQAPYLVREVRKGGTQQALDTFTSKPIGFPMNREMAERLARMMRGVVTGGTGSAANVRGISVYGKTGTAEQTGGEDHAWFIGFAVKERGGAEERIAFAVILERGGTGGRIAAPVARDLLRHWAEE
ncbi:MAG: peptidoglycan D,D-transpeptidase FtsI family protein [Armatimonadota bacterium]